MNKEKFLTYISNPSELSEEDIPLLEAYIEKYPYCQIGHMFLAKLAHEYNQPDKTLKLNQAALRTVNRAVLKMIMENRWSILPTNPEITPIEDHFTETKTENITEMQFNTQDEQSESIQEKDQTELNEPVSDENIVIFQETEVQDDTDLETGSEEIITESQNIDTEIPDTENTEPTPDQDTDSNSVYSNVTDQIIEAIAENKILREKLQNMNAEDLEIVGEDNKAEQKEVIPEATNVSSDDEGENASDLRKKQQFEIIDNFINNESFLVKRKLKVPEGPQKPQEDLSLRSSSLNDELISENLALIMKDQGKIDKAIDIYKKLIWKFPQKKAYFASLIEELKK